MKQFPTLFFAASLVFLMTALQSPVHAFDLSNSLSSRSCAFYSPEAGPYIETYFNIHGEGIRYEKQSSGRYLGKVQVTLIIQQGAEVVDYEKYILESPLVNDTSGIKFSITDQKRMAAANGAITVELTIEDLVDPTNKMTVTEELLLDFDQQVCISDIQLVDDYKKSRSEDKFVKNGVEMLPYATNYFPGNRNKLIFYAENYLQGAEEDQILFTASLREQGVEEVNPNFWQYEKLDRSPVSPLLKEFDLSNLPTGNYDLVLEIRNKKNEVMCEKRLFFQRLNTQAVTTWENISMLETSGTFADKYNPDQLKAYMQFLKPKADPNELNMIISMEKGDPEMQKKLLYNFWLKRDSVDPYKSWLSYLLLVKKANDAFGTVSRHGYRTDRGRVMLQYGEPNDILTVKNEPGAYPYETWQYYTVGQGTNIQNNIRFIFYEPSIVTNDYILIHSTARGELQDPRWKMKVYENTADPNRIKDLDETEIDSYFGTRGDDW